MPRGFRSPTRRPQFPAGSSGCACPSSRPRLGRPSCRTLLRWRRRAARSWPPRLPHEWHAEAAIWRMEANRRSAAPAYKASKEPRRQPSALWTLPGGLWCKRQDLAHYDVGRAAGGVGMSKLTGVEQLFEGRHFDREVIILCVRWSSDSHSAIAIAISRKSWRRGPCDRSCDDLEMGPTLRSRTQQAVSPRTSTHE